MPTRYFNHQAWFAATYGPRPARYVCSFPSTLISEVVLVEAKVTYKTAVFAIVLYLNSNDGRTIKAHTIAEYGEGFYAEARADALALAKAWSLDCVLWDDDGKVSVLHCADDRPELEPDDSTE